MSKRLHIDSSFSTLHLLSMDMKLLKDHSIAISERIYQMEKQIAIEMAYQSRLERIIRIKESIKLEEAQE